MASPSIAPRLRISLWPLRWPTHWRHLRMALQRRITSDSLPYRRQRSNSRMWPHHRLAEWLPGLGRVDPRGLRVALSL